MIHYPLVSIICLCYNHGRFVAECLTSVFNQSYPAIECIIVDDCSTDTSVPIIQNLLRTQDQLITNRQNLGICKSFNKGLQLAKGKYIVDLAADDYLLPETIRQQVSYFETLSEEYGAIFGEAILVNEAGNKIGTWYKRDEGGQLIQSVPQGDVFAAVLAGTPILTVTAMTRKVVYDALNGYDESLLYEDFDFLVRASRHWKYAFKDEYWVNYRQVAGSQSRNQQTRRAKQLESTFMVCKKAAAMIRTPEEETALLWRLKQGIKQCFYLEHYSLVRKYATLHESLKPLSASYRAILWACQLRVPFYQIYRGYQKIRR
ncbi:glycosyltransferase [Siphonobacter sp. SORGH_AS_0500]|uniref:glycosyltransferase n=1 Tax=Siphonobacter sp. SORGH_AS_0500 TaxID=1864824 RepID=UPI0028564800|nr:glycosyltransferase [Siphonobacter sp. SORGH_AS_0500]MDR6195528.1 glycosyltransferase involved in cell wall biosynthesis [Siphonobacter sp. SORGH_AS_0500]